MAIVKFFLDTGALIALAGLKEPDLQNLKNRMKAGNLELNTTHVQTDEITAHIKFHEKVTKKHEKRVATYQQKIDRALESLKSKGIEVHFELAKMGAWGVMRWGYFKWGGKETGKLYDDLRKEIGRCEEAKGTIKPLLNIACDAVIAVSSLDHDFFITCDKCLFNSWHKVIVKHPKLKQRFKVPKVIYTRRNPKEVASAI